MKKLLFALLFAITGINADAQIGLGLTTPHPNAYFQINSTNKGVLLPRMTAVQRLAIAPTATANGLMVFDTDSIAYMYWTGIAWKKVGSGDENWIKNGNNIYNSNIGNVGIGTSTPAASALLDVSSNSKGVLLPRMSKIQRNAIASPAAGLIVFQNAPDSVGLYYFDGTTWQWMEQSGKSWSLNGNAGTSPFSNILGTTDPSDLAIGCGNIPRMYVTNEAEVGIGLPSPVYGLDVTTGNAAIDNCTYNGIRVKNMLGGPSNTCENGLLLGYLSPLSGTDDEAVIRNFGLTGSGVKTMALGVGSMLTMMRLSSNGLAGIGSGNMIPKYSLDINNGIGGVWPCSRNGIRLNTLQLLDNPCDNGFFMGYDITSNNNAVSFWNFSTDNTSTNRYIRFGFGTDFSESPIGESVRILPPGEGVGINQVNPQAMLHITNYSGGGVLPGVMVTSPSLNTGDKGFFTGLKTSGLLTGNDGYIWNYQNAPLIAGTNDLERMRITEDGNVGIGTTTPVSPLSFTSSVGNKIALWGNDANNHYGLGLQGGLLQLYAATSVDNIGFGVGSSTNFTERMRVQGNGNVGIGNTDPGYLLDVNNRMRIRSGGDLSNTAGVWFNRTDNAALQAFVGIETDNTVGFYGTGSGWGFTMNTSTGKVKIADGTQADGRVLTSDANGIASWIPTNSNKAAVNATFPGGGVNLTTAMGAAYTNLFIDLPPGKWLVIGTYLMSQGGSSLLSGQSMFVRTSFSSSNVANIATGDIIGSGLMSGNVGYPTPFGVLNGQNIVNNTSGATKRYYVWAAMTNTGGQPVGFFLNNFCGNFWSENNLVALPMN